MCKLPTHKTKSKDKENTMEVPVVDFQQLRNKEEELKKLREACERCGCFRIINHTVPETLMADMKSVAKYLHDLPVEIKTKNKPVIPESGYRPPSEISPFYEGLALYDIHKSPQAVDQFCSQLGVPPKQRKTIEAYGEAVNDLATSVSQKMAESLDVVSTDFKDWPLLFRVIKYSFNAESIGSVGIPIHTDTSFVTLLQDDDKVGGLEIMDHSGSFKAVPPQSGSFLCIIGDVGHIWSNGRFHNVKHRVLCKEATTRLSFGVFMFSPRDGKIDTPTELVDLNHPRLYRSFNYEDLRQFRVSARGELAKFLANVANV
ncbi:2-oxoglutarate-dependent dioxygenase DAO-like [Arachis stenosperma]|uniref:2-oxoglutarate-dependent dioxygenase DAO-like n=1 Tax=Arachis stenosperma TaxID=217475 RepID=UPI0025AC5B48|nr:2-oxoglutarate-dependent dioxygenase DAO-like [Arachis stenosperma]